MDSSSGTQNFKPDKRETSGWAWVLFALLLATLGSWLIDHHLSLTSQAMLYVLAVVVVAYRVDWIKSATGAVAAVTALNFFFVPPRFTLEVESRDHLLALAVMLVVALVISRLTSNLRQETELARISEQRAQQLQSLATGLAAASSQEEVADTALRAFNQAFTGPNWLFLGDSLHLNDGQTPAAIVQDGLACCIREAAVLGPGTGRWPGIDAWYVPLGTRKDRIHGAVCIRPAISGDVAGREHAVAMGAIVGQALSRIALNQSMQRAQAQAQRQQLQNTFLASISHDLRTPLAAIVGAASSLISQAEKLSPQQRGELHASIADEARYLSAVTENTLQLARLGSEGQALRLDWESIEEIIGSAVARIDKLMAERILLKLSHDLPLIKADPVLLTQLLVNLLENALKYSVGAVTVEARVVERTLELLVKDRGPGIPAPERDRVFDPYARADRSGQRGAGLGLAVCRAIAQAHGAELVLRERQAGGCSFCLIVPVPEQAPRVAEVNA